MINTKTTGYRSLSYCLPLIIYILLVFPHSIATSQLNLSSCLLQCRLSIKEGPRAHVNFTQMLKTESIRAIFFDLYIGNKTTHIGTRRTIFYAWIKKNLGKGVFTLPSDYIALTFSLYAVFISKLKISFQESSPGCYHRFHDDYCKGYITFAALTDFTRLKENCTNDSCGTICRRNYTKHDGWLGDKIVFSCCHKDLLTGDINIDKCLTEERADWYVSLMQAVSTIISIHLGGMALNRFINKYLDRQILYTTIGSIRVRILNPSPLQDLGMIPTRIIKVKDKVEDEMNALLNAKKGVLEVYLANGYDEIKIDVPAKLKDPKVMKNLKKYISWILNQPHHQIFDGISKIVIQYEIKTVNDNQKQTTVSLLQCTNGCENCPYSQGFQQVKHCIENHLNINNSQDFIKWTKQVYFIHDDIAHHKLISIPSELYQYLRYYVPMISSSLWRLISSIILASGLLFIFVLTILLDYRTQLFSSLNSALAHVPNIYLATILSMNYLVATEIDEETIDRILIANIIQYRRGYRLFLERGIYFQPILQSFRATFEHYHRKNKTIKFYIPEVDSNSNRSVGSTVSSGNQSVITTEANSDITQSINSPSTEIATDSAFQLNTGHSAAEIHNVQTIDDAYKDGVEEEISIHENQSNQANSLIYKGEIQFRLIFQAIKNIFIRTSNSSENSAIAERVGIKGEREPLVDKFATDPIA
ncbi:uncharacterized protein TRIADDRAFT_60554 [Trichoplax adhaerens]|uniref:Uncharacterized protein n=1 Tax=Trichoplax adhaerens TaxID=10228 RepID=B3S8I6_TRIAD|nr:predicted protein [Trichoplax adhaerens]EDV20961.1 predicted protein [Trichoplax adhaerens]|eukprot:XP_002116605.1 predicted protein [Trichoplax adhaerens]